MKKLSLVTICIMVLFSCSQDTALDQIIPVDVKGSVTKGSFLSGSNISFLELDDRNCKPNAARLLRYF